METESKVIIKSINDIETLMRWRAEVIENVFGEKPTETLMEANRRYYLSHVKQGKHYAFLALSDNEEAGTGSICLSEELPSPDNPSGKCAYLMNIYVREKYRTHGIGHRIVRHLIEEAKKSGCGKIYLETTDDGRPVYESLGFKDLKDIMKLNDN